MKNTNPVSEYQPKPEDSPIAWFGELLLARDRCDLPRAVEAQRQLDRLGWTVRYRRPRHGAADQGVAR